MRVGVPARMTEKTGGSRNIPAHRPPWNWQGDAFSAVPEGDNRA